MTRAALCLAALALSACVASDGPADPYAFVGTWECGGTTLSFTNTSYDDGTNSYPIQAVGQDGRNYTLRFGNGTVMSLVAVTDTGLTRVSGTTGTQLNCRRAG